RPICSDGGVIAGARAQQRRDHRIDPAGRRPRRRNPPSRLAKLPHGFGTLSQLFRGPRGAPPRAALHARAATGTPTAGRGLGRAVAVEEAGARMTAGNCEVGNTLTVELAAGGWFVARLAKVRRLG